jgi:hypothetical protein
VKSGTAETIRAGLAAGQRRQQSAKNAGVSVSTVYRVRDQICSVDPDFMPGIADRGSPNEWLLSELSAELQVSAVTLDGWRRNGWLLGRQIAGPRTRWLLWADADELCRLRQLHQLTRGHAWPYPTELTTPKKAFDERRK